VSDGLFSSPPRVARARLLALDPDLGTALDRADAERADQALTVHVARLPTGPWQPRLTVGPGALGLLVVDGLIVREIDCAASASAELLGAGDVLRPGHDDGDALVAPRTTWFVPEGARVAVLDARLTAALAAFPTVTAELFERSVRRTRTQAILRSTSQLRRLDHRTLLYLWHVGERFGRVTPQGLCLRLPLTHERLAALVGAHRPSFTTSLSKLERAGLLRRGDDYQLVLTADARAVVEQLVGAAPAVAA
jgi:CRP/FNR family transcriptional regulator, cyclic AMP receptor protein